MTRVPPLSGVLLALGVALLIAPALVPVQPVLYHDTDASTTANRTMLEAEGLEVVAYENLSPRGQELYVEALQNDGDYFVPRGEGAPEFAYPTNEELAALRDDYRARTQLQSIVVERPPNSSLPPPGERVEAAEHMVRNERERAERRKEAREGTSGERTPETSTDDATVTPDGPTPTPSGPSVEELRRQIARYDQMTTRTDLPPLFAPRSLLRLLSVAAGTIAIGTGGYLRSKP